MEAEDDFQVGGVKLSVQIISNFYPEIYVGHLVVCASALVYFTIVYAHFVSH